MGHSPRRVRELAQNPEQAWSRDGDGGCIASCSPRQCRLSLGIEAKPILGMKDCSTESSGSCWCQSEAATRCTSARRLLVRISADAEKELDRERRSEYPPTSLPMQTRVGKDGEDLGEERPVQQLCDLTSEKVVRRRETAVRLGPCFSQKASLFDRPGNKQKHSKTERGSVDVRRRQSGPEVLPVHPGGPFWAKKDEGAWTLPKGGPAEREDLLDAAQHEFSEETRFEAHGPFHELGTIIQAGGKKVSAWAFEGDCDPAALNSNFCRIEWPPRSNRAIQIPEVDRGGLSRYPKRGNAS